jgi:thioredoxin reductase (NADPH)
MKANDQIDLSNPCAHVTASMPRNAQRCSTEEVIVVGGGNSAGQAATYLATTCRKVHIFVRGTGPGGEHVALPDPAHRGDPEHHAPSLHGDHQAPWRRQSRTGALPRQLQEGGDDTPRATRRWPLERTPHLFETSHPRIFAVGDARSTSVKRVASAVGEGSVCIRPVHESLSE